MEIKRWVAGFQLKRQRDKFASTLSKAGIGREEIILYSTEKEFIKDVREIAAGLGSDDKNMQELASERLNKMKPIRSALILTVIATQALNNSKNIE